MIEGAATINDTNAPLVFVRPAALILNNLVLDGGSLSNNAGTLRDAVRSGNEPARPAFCYDARPPAPRMNPPPLA